MKLKIDPEKWAALLKVKTQTDIAATLDLGIPRVTRITQEIEEGHEFNPFTVGEYERRLGVSLELSPAPVDSATGAAK